MIKIHMHIGQPKTGSSSIQRFLSCNKNALQKKGYLYEAGNGVNHRHFFQSIFASRDPKTSYNSFMNDQFKIAKERNCEHIIISHEGLFFLQDEKLEYFPKQFKDQTQLYVFLRRQDLYLESAWKQWHFKNLDYKNFEDYVARFKIPNYFTHLKKWSKLVETDSMFVTPFEKQKFPNGIEIYFLNSIGITDTETMDFNISDDGWGANKGLTAEGLAIAFLVREISKNDIHDHSIQYFINKHFSNLQKEHFTGYELLSFSQRQEILSRHESINQNIADIFMHKNTPLFESDIETSSSVPQNDLIIDYEVYVKELMRIGIEQDTLIKELKSKIKKNKKY